MIKGNCEIELAAESDTCGCGFEAGSTCDLLSRGWYAFANQQVSADQRQFMGALPDHLFLNIVESVMSFCMAVSVMFPSFYFQQRLIKIIKA